MSDGKAGSIPPSDKKHPEALVQPFDGGLAFKDRCRHLPEALRKPKTKAEHAWLQARDPQRRRQRWPSTDTHAALTCLV